MAQRPVVPRPGAKPWPPDRCYYSVFHGDNRPEGPVAALVENLAVSEAHVSAEEANDIPRIMGTVDPTPRFGLSNVMGSPGFQMITTYEGVHRFYIESRATFEILRSRSIKQILSDWYVYREVVATTRPLSPVNGQRVPGAERTSTAVSFCPMSPGGLIGELPVGRPEAARTTHTGVVKVRNGASPLPETEVRNNDLHDLLTDAFLRGDIPAILARFTDDCLWVTRDYYGGAGPMAAPKGKAEFRRFLERMYQAVDVVGIINLHRVATEWYVFAEQVVRLRHKGTLFGLPATGAEFSIRLAGTSPIGEDGLFLGHLGWGTDMEAVLRQAIRDQKP